MFLERRHAREILSVQYEMRDAPFQRLLKAGCMLMHQFAQMVQDRLREGLRLREIVIDARVTVQRGHRAATSKMSASLQPTLKRLAADGDKIERASARARVCKSM